jgi:hypothetical protein
MPKSTNPVSTLSDFESSFAANLAIVSAANGIGQPKDLTLPKNPVTVAPRVKSAQDWASKQIANTKAGSSNWLKGVLSPKRNPIEAAIAANAKRKQKLAEAETQERWLKSMKTVDVNQMYATIEKGGASAFETGISKREGKITAAIVQLQPMVQALAESLDKMPQDTPEQREAKMIAAKRGMEQIGRARRGIK